MEFNYDVNEVGNRLTNKRMECKFTQEQVADMIGISTDSLSNYENGKRAISAEMLARLSVVYKTSIEYFIGVGQESSSNSEGKLQPEILIMLSKYNNKQQKALFSILKGIEEFNSAS